MHIENRLLQIMRRRNKKQSDVTRATHINCGQLSRFASGSNNSTMGIGQAIKIADYIDCSMDELFCREKYIKAHNDLLEALERLYEHAVHNTDISYTVIKAAESALKNAKYME